VKKKSKGKGNRKKKKKKKGRNESRYSALNPDVRVYPWPQQKGKERKGGGTAQPRRSGPAAPLNRKGGRAAATGVVSSHRTEAEHPRKKKSLFDTQHFEPLARKEDEGGEEKKKGKKGNSDPLPLILGPQFNKRRGGREKTPVPPPGPLIFRTRVLARAPKAEKEKGEKKERKKKIDQGFHALLRAARRKKKRGKKPRSRLRVSSPGRERNPAGERGTFRTTSSCDRQTGGGREKKKKVRLDASHLERLASKARGSPREKKGKKKGPAPISVASTFSDFPAPRRTRAREGKMRRFRCGSAARHRFSTTNTTDHGLRRRTIPTARPEKRGKEKKKKKGTGDVSQELLHRPSGFLDRGGGEKKRAVARGASFFPITSRRLSSALPGRRRKKKRKTPFLSIEITGIPRLTRRSRPLSPSHRKTKKKKSDRRGQRGNP